MVRGTFAYYGTFDCAFPLKKTRTIFNLITKQLGCPCGENVASSHHWTRERQQQSLHSAACSDGKPVAAAAASLHPLSQRAISHLM